MLRSYFSGTGDSFMRDDRMGDVTAHLKGMSAAERAAAVAEKVRRLPSSICACSTTLYVGHIRSFWGFVLV
jgi:hypothetical protein